MDPSVPAGGLVGLTVFLLALFLVPAGLGWRCRRADRVGVAGAPGVGAGVVPLLHMVDSLQNMAYLSPTPLIGGGLVGLFLGRHSGRLDIPPIASSADREEAGSRVPVLVTIVVLIAIGILGSLPRTPALEPPSPPAPDNPATIDQPSPTPPSSP